MSSDLPTESVRIALLSDIHGNLPALEAVLDDAGRNGAETVWNLGDTVGYGPFPEACVQRVRKACAVSLRGNFDRKTLVFPQKMESWRETKEPHKLEALRLAWEGLSADSRCWLTGLPVTEKRSVNGRSFFLCHGSPSSDDEPVQSSTPDGRLDGIFADTDAEVVCTGHTHRALFLPRNTGILLNPGSVGRPDGGDSRAGYMLLDGTAKELTVEHRRMDYEIDRVEVALRGIGAPPRFAAVFRSGRSLDRVLDSTDPDPTDDLVAQAAGMADRLEGDLDHARQVRFLALSLFDGLEPLHDLDHGDRNLLEAAALLHDVGLLQGAEGHHKASMRIILEELTQVPPDLRRLVALVARYHRKALPRDDHPVYQDLPAPEQNRVRMLAGLLRLADGLDRSHRDVVSGVRVRLGLGGITVSADICAEAQMEKEGFEMKKDLLEITVGIPLHLKASWISA